MRATNDVTATSRDQVNRTGTQHHSAAGHLDPQPYAHYTRSLAAASHQDFRVPFGCLAARPHVSVNQPVKQSSGARALNRLPAPPITSQGRSRANESKRGPMPQASSEPINQANFANTQEWPCRDELLNEAEAAAY